MDIVSLLPDASPRWPDGQWRHRVIRPAGSAPGFARANRPACRRVPCARDHAQRRPSGAASRRRAAAPPPVHDAHLEQIDRLAFLHEFAQLATHARDWDELMRTVVDRTTVAMGVEVCSFYLLDRDGQTLTLAATNGLDPGQVGSVSLSMRPGHHRAGGRRANAGHLAAT